MGKYEPKDAYETAAFNEAKEIMRGASDYQDARRFLASVLIGAVEGAADSDSVLAKVARRYVAAFREVWEGEK